MHFSPLVSALLPELHKKFVILSNEPIIVKQHNEHYSAKKIRRGQNGYLIVSAMCMVIVCFKTTACNQY